jgi:hypothetical protein
MAIPTPKKSDLEPKPTANEPGRRPRIMIVIGFFAPAPRRQNEQAEEEAMNILPRMAM